MPLHADIAVIQTLNEPTKNSEANSTDELSIKIESLPDPSESSSFVDTHNASLILEQKIQQKKDQIGSTKQTMIKRMNNQGWLDDHLSNSLNRK